MRDLIDWLCNDESARTKFGEHGRQTILNRHTCGHRADALLEVLSR
jgi:spore maturation protein CgeB